MQRSTVLAGIAGALVFVVGSCAIFAALSFVLTIFVKPNVATAFLTFALAMVLALVPAVGLGVVVRHRTRA